MRAVKRLMNEINMEAKDCPPNIFIEHNMDNIKEAKVLLIGPKDTIYENGFYYFDVVCPDSYPLKSPKVTFLSAIDKNCRMHPNLYATGKVCLSILGTWRGPSWSPKITIQGIFQTIESLLDNEPIKCEPGHDNATQEEIEEYNKVVQYRVFKSAVLWMMERKDIPERFQEVIKDYVKDNMDWYVEKMEELKKNNGKAECFHGKENVDYDKLLEKLNNNLNE